MNPEITGMWYDEGTTLVAKKVRRLLRADHKTRAAERTAWNRYSIHDRDAVKKRLAVQHKAKQDVAAKLGQPIPNDYDFAVAVMQNDVRRMRHSGALNNKYVPHQGKQECARRVRQAMSPWAREQHGL